MDYFNAFWTGGLICALVQILMDKTSRSCPAVSWFFSSAAVPF